MGSVAGCSPAGFYMSESLNHVPPTEKKAGMTDYYHNGTTVLYFHKGIREIHFPLMPLNSFEGPEVELRSLQSLRNRIDLPMKCECVSCLGSCWIFVLDGLYSTVIHFMMHAYSADQAHAYVLRLERSLSECNWACGVLAWDATCTVHNSALCLRSPFMMITKLV